MTIIVSDGHLMVADSWSFRAGVGYPLPAGRHKITRAPDGSLVGAAGMSPNCYRLSQWVADGMDFANVPTFYDDRQDPADKYLLDILWLKPDGTLWRLDDRMAVFPIGAPYAIGLADAATMIEGAMACGVHIVEATRMAVARCAYVGGPLQIEALLSREPRA